MRFSVIFTSVTLFTFTVLSTVFAEDITIPVEPNKAMTAKDVNGITAVASHTFPYIGEIIGVDVYYRSGPGLNYYRCGKLNAPEQVKVVAEQNGWLKIVPPAGSFSWVTKESVRIDVNAPGDGRITGNDVRVRAGSAYFEPIHSTHIQTKLQKGDTVTLLGEEKGDYYKIAPPQNAYLWVSAEYVKYISPVDDQGDIESPTSEGISVEANVPAAAPKKFSAEAEKLKEYRVLSKLIDAERAKPLNEQNWSVIKEGLQKIVDANDAGKAAKYAKRQLERVEGYEVAGQVGGEMKRQKEELGKTREQIEKKRQEELAQIPNVGKFAIIGRLRPSLLYSSPSKAKRYLITDETGRIIAYAMPDDSAASLDVTAFYNKKVGFVGKLERDLQTGSTIVKYTELIEIK